MKRITKVGIGTLGVAVVIGFIGSFFPLPEVMRLIGTLILGTGATIGVAGILTSNGNESRKEDR